MSVSKSSAGLFFLWFQTGIAFSMLAEQTLHTTSRVSPFAKARARAPNMFIIPSFVERVGSYLVTPLVKSNDSGQFLASVSIRRGAYDRIFRFASSFPTSALALQHALVEGRDMVLANELN